MWFFWLSVIVLVLYYIGKTQKAPQRGKTKRAAQSTVSRASPSQPSDADDAWEGSFYDIVGPQRSANKTVNIRYSDANGKETERIVHVLAYESSGSSGLVIGRCHLRNATRTFRFDRMKRVVDNETGEIIADLQKSLNDEWEASPQPMLDKLYDQHKDVLKLMLYMAKADGSVRMAELDVITRYCVSVTGDERITISVIKALLQYVDAVTVTTFSRTYNKLRRERPADAARMVDVCKALVATQKTIHPNEQAVLDVLAKPLPAPK